MFQVICLGGPKVEKQLVWNIPWIQKFCRTQGHQDPVASLKAADIHHITPLGRPKFGSNFGRYSSGPSGWKLMEIHLRSDKKMD